MPGNKQRVLRRVFKSKFTERRVGGATVYHLNRVPKHLEDYYNEILSVLVHELEKSGTVSKFALCFAKHIEAIPPGVISIMVQHEQTIIVGEPDTETEIPEELVASAEPSKTVRLFGGLSAFEKATWIIEYSAGNRANILDSDLAYLYRDKCVYFAPVSGVCATAPNMPEPMVCHTMFGNWDNERRHRFSSEVAAAGVRVENRAGFDSVRAGLSGVAILANVRQKEYFQTPEELRILPALMEGTRVVTEPAPYLREVPYAHLLTVASLSEMPEKIAELSRDSGNLAAWFDGVTQVVNRLVDQNQAGLRRIASYRLGDSPKA